MYMNFEMDKQFTLTLTHQKMNIFVCVVNFSNFFVFTLKTIVQKNVRLKLNNFQPVWRNETLTIFSSNHFFKRYTKYSSFEEKKQSSS